MVHENALLGVVRCTDCCI